LSSAGRGRGSGTARAAAQSPHTMPIAVNATTSFTTACIGEHRGLFKIANAHTLSPAPLGEAGEGDGRAPISGGPG
jgi:hypothetical protein